MERDKFFYEITQQINDIRHKKQYELTRIKAEWPFVIGLMPRILIVIDEYRKFLDDKGIPIDFRQNGLSLDFKMHFSNGGQYGFGIGFGSKKSLELCSYSSGPEPKGRTIHDSQVISSVTWKDELFEIFVQTCIIIFLEHEMQHGGYLQPK